MGLADPLLAEGIYYAYKSEQLATDAIKHSFDNPENALPNYSQLLSRHVISELKFAKMGRQLLFSLPSKGYYKVVSFALKHIPHLCEQVVQGQHAFKWLRPLRL